MRARAHKRTRNALALYTHNFTPTRPLTHSHTHANIDIDIDILYFTILTKYSKDESVPYVPFSWNTEVQVAPPSTVFTICAT